MSRHLPSSHIKNLCSMFSKRFMWISAFRHRRQTDFANKFLFRYLLLCICVFAVPRQTRLLFCRRTIWDKVSSSCQNPTHRGTRSVARRETRNLTPQMALSAYFWILIEPAKLTSPPDSTHLFSNWCSSESGWRLALRGAGYHTSFHSTGIRKPDHVLLTRH